MNNIIILSIHKQHADNILSGKKIYEFRKSKPKKDNPPYLVLLYETQSGGGAGAIVGACVLHDTFTITSCELDTPMLKLWRKTLAEGGCVTPEYLAKYAAGKDVAVWCVNKPVRFKEPLPMRRLWISVPQSWRYL